ncbi:helix-turn-helix transcriptional regulator [Cohnella thailandensis]|uniref:Helix-turn-helix domain-containing protein n=1 Tax=Cohnella thailandensis TaxID=557557 RepID=A0A841SXZ7_9BACL|nr:AraC family transcriptional regulator [Cohnella thailandensis]MBB6634477.1 helix-turn-helix domain-containing protein [Cohnella thailandensis]MBP1972969.1 AraC-like DNA-binding protein [Cohnella thailandensis]
MREHIFLPKPLFPRHVCFPDFIGGYSDYPDHSVNREFRTTDLNLDRSYNLHIVIEGKGYLLTEGKRYELTKGQGFLFGPGLRQRYYSDAENPWSIRWVHFFGERLEELLDGKGVGEPWLFALTELEPFVDLTDRLLALGRTYRVEDEYGMASTLYELLTRLQTLSDRLNVPIDPAADKIRAVANYVRTHSAESFSIEQAAALAGYSAHYFSRKFGRTFGKSFPDFVLESRLIQAKRLLVSTPLSVKEIALETGFSQASYFISCFKRSEGMTPAEFRSFHKLGTDAGYRL